VIKIETEYLVLQTCVESLMMAIERYESNPSPHSDKKKFDVHDEMNNLIAFYRGNFPKYYMV
jgi:hypothetical protein